MSTPAPVETGNFGAWWRFCQAPNRDGLANDGPMTRWGWTYPTWVGAIQMYMPNANTTYAAFTAMTQTAAGSIAQLYFWTRLGGTMLNRGVDASFIDWCWTSGGAAKQVQQALDCHPDGIVGPLTLKAMNAVPVTILVQNIHDWRTAYYDSLGFRSKYPGLYDRADACLVLAETLITPPARPALVS